MEQLRQNVGDEIASLPQIWFGVDKHIVQVPIQKGTAVNIVAMVTDRSKGRNPEWKEPTWVYESFPPEEMLKDFEGWIEPVQALLTLMKKPSKWALVELPPLDHFVDGRVGLIGDAAHAMLPHQGSGASQAIEDAFILAHLLSDSSVSRENAPNALLAYEAVRKERAQAVQETSYEAGRVYSLVSDCGDDREKLAENLSTRFDWIWNVDHRLELQKGLSQLS